MISATDKTPAYSTSIDAACHDSGPVAGQRDHLLRRAAVLSVVVGVVILVIKVGAWLLTGSTAIMGDALESIVHVVATVVMMVSLRIAQRPPDQHHPYGHGKAASFSVGFEGGLVFLSGVMVVVAVIERLVWGSELTDLGLGLIGIAMAIVILGALGGYLMWIGRKHRSRVLIADAHHVLADAWTSIGVLVGLGLVQLTGLMWLDWVVALGVAAHLLWVGGKLVAEGCRDLFDHADPEELEHIVVALNRQRDQRWYDVHRLRLHSVGELRHIDLHLVVTPDMNIAEAHHMGDVIEAAILAELELDGSVLVHFDSARPDQQPLDTDITLADAIRWQDNPVSGHHRAAAVRQSVGSVGAALPA